MIDAESRRARDAARRTLREIGQRERREAKERRPANPKADRGRERDNGDLFDAPPRLETTTQERPGGPT